MRKLIFALTLMISAVAISSCDKQEIKQKETAPANAVWVTPNGKVIPYSEAANWQAYEKANFSEEKIDIK